MEWWDGPSGQATLATHTNESGTYHLQPTRLLGEPWELWLEKEKVSTAVKIQLLEHTSGLAAKDYWANKMRFHGMEIKSIGWTVIQLVVMAMTIKQCRWTTKFTTGFCMTGKMMHRWGKWTLAACPCCEHKTETTAHILQCAHPGAQSISNQCQLRNLLKDLDTEPNIIQDISAGFNAWQCNLPTPPMLTNAGQLQTFISWENFSQSFLAISWQTRQQNYYENQQDRWSSAKWMAKLLKWVLKHVCQQWDHWNNKSHKQNPHKVKDLILDERIQEQYNIRIDGITRMAHALFQATVDQTITLSHNSKQQWLASMKAARNQHQWASAHSIVAQRALLHNWLHPQQPATPNPPPALDPQEHLEEL